MKKIIYSVFLIFSVFVFLGCGFGKNPFDDTFWHCYKISERMTDVADADYTVSETWYFDKDGSFEVSSERGDFSGSWTYDEPILTITTNRGMYDGTYSASFDGDLLELNYYSDRFSITYYLEQEKDDSSIFDDLFGWLK